MEDDEEGDMASTRRLILGVIDDKNREEKERNEDCEGDTEDAEIACTSSASQSRLYRYVKMIW